MCVDMTDVHGLAIFVFFFQAEDGIRDYKVTGVQTCALPISVAFWAPCCRGVAWFAGAKLIAAAARLANTGCTVQTSAGLPRHVSPVWGIRGVFGSWPARRCLSQSTVSTWIAPATGMAPRAPRMPANSAPIKIEIKTTSGESCTVRP